MQESAVDSQHACEPPSSSQSTLLHGAAGTASPHNGGDWIHLTGPGQLAANWNLGRRGIVTR